MEKEKLITQNKNSSKLNGVQESFCQKLLEEEMTQFLQADKYQRTEKRCGCCNGYREILGVEIAKHRNKKVPRKGILIVLTDTLP
ncbi:transposase [Candidatus Aerophobetes bacterium]|nr:transposase [Candidatus Aerophobetes bacterium]